MKWTPRPVDRLSGRLLVVIALLAALAPFATDIYLPAFPAMTHELDASPSSVQLTLTAFLLGAGLGQFLFGPISDRVGRRVPLIVGTALCVLAGLVAANAANITVLIVARLIQGLSGAAGMVLGRAIISDIARGKEAAKAFNLASMVLGIAPVAAPLIGAFLADLVGWRGLLLIVVGLSIATLLAVIFLVPETYRGSANVTAAHDHTQVKGSGIMSRVFFGSTAVFVFGFAAMMAYISASPFIYQVMIGMNVTVYGIVFGLTALAITGVSYCAARFAHRFQASTMLRVGVLVLLASAVVLAVLVAVQVPPAWLIAPLFFGVAAMGLVFGNATAMALSAVPHAAGIGSAILGASQFVIGALVSPLVGIAGEHTAVPLAIVFGLSALLAAGALFSLAAPTPIRLYKMLSSAT